MVGSGRRSTRVQIAQIPADEAERLSVLRSLKVLDTPMEDVFEDVVQLAQALARAPMAMVSLVDGDRQWFAARAGVQMEQTPRDVAFCAHAILEDRVFWV